MIDPFTGISSVSNEQVRLYNMYDVQPVILLAHSLGMRSHKEYIRSKRVTLFFHPRRIDIARGRMTSYCSQKISSIIKRYAVLA